MLLILQIFTACRTFPAALAVGLRFYLNEKTPAAEIRSVSGRVASVGDAQFTLNLNENEPEKLTFLIDSEAKMEGQLAIGANATVDYRSSGGKNMATGVIVVPDSGLRP